MLTRRLRPHSTAINIRTKRSTWNHIFSFIRHENKPNRFSTIQYSVILVIQPVTLLTQRKHAKTPAQSILDGPCKCMNAAERDLPRKRHWHCFWVKLSLRVRIHMCTRLNDGTPPQPNWWLLNRINKYSSRSQYQLRLSTAGSSYLVCLRTLLIYDLLMVWTDLPLDAAFVDFLFRTSVILKCEKV